MPLISDGQAREDSWRHLEDDEALPADGAAVTVSLARWERNETELRDCPHANQKEEDFGRKNHEKSSL